MLFQMKELCVHVLKIINSYKNTRKSCICRGESKMLREKNELEHICNEMRQDILRMSRSAGDSGMHFGGTLSMIEIVCVLYLEIMQWSKDKIKQETRDRFILSKGHGIPAVYAVLRQVGVIELEELDTFKKDETRLFGHPCIDKELGIEFSSGSLGQGLSLGVGSAIALKRKNNPAKVYVLLGDGECDEGAIWEAAMSASQYGLNNLVAIVDRNKLQYDGDTERIMSLNSLEEKWKSFGWEVISIDGHDVECCYEAFTYKCNKPLVIIANTIKGKGISFMENEMMWHHKKMTKSQEKIAMEELGFAGI